MKDLLPQEYFNLNDFEFKEIFDDVNYVWEAIPKISKYIGKIKSPNGITVGEGTKIHPTAVILGPAIIGKNCVIGPHAYLRENCLLGDDVHVGHAAEIKNTILLNGAKVAHLNYVGDSIIGIRVNISGGALVSNYRLDKKPIRIRYGAEIIETNLKKLGSIIGDDSFIGAGVVLNPGTILGKKTLVYPLITVKGVHCGNSTIKE